MNYKIILSFLIYILILLILFIYKPSIMFDKNKNMKKYDLNDSLLTIEIVAPILAILSYFIVLTLYIYI